MHEKTAPRVTLDATIVRENILAWRAFAGRPIWAVVKSDGYGFGLREMLAILENVADGYCVVDYEEFLEARAHTRKPVIVLGRPSAGEAVAIAQGEGHPNIASLDALRAVEAAARAAGKRFPVRLGVSPARGWFGMAPNEIDAYARIAASEYLYVEMWTHLLSPASDEKALRDFHELCVRFEAAGVVIAVRDVVNSRGAADGVAAGERVRLGSGIFGAHSGAVPGVRNALRVHAKLIESSIADAATIAGYRQTPISAGTQTDVLRIGYGDGFPRGLIGASLRAGTVASVGMQFTVMQRLRNENSLDVADSQRIEDFQGPANARSITNLKGTTSQQPATADGWVSLFSKNDDLAVIAAAGSTAAHEIICGLGNYSRRQLQTP